MKNVFKVAKYEQTESSFNHCGYDEYIITYLKGLKIHELRIVVNGMITNQKINLVSPLSMGYKSQILAAISDFKNDKIKNKQLVSKSIKISTIKTFYNRNIVRNIEKYLIPINKEESRDVLSEFKLI
jgi:hypothetical protein